MSEDARQKVEKMVSVEKEQFAEVNALGSQKKPWQKVEKMVSVEKEQFAEVNALGSQKKPWQKMQPTQSGYEYDCNRLKRRVRLLQNAESDEYDANENVCGIIEAITNQALISTSKDRLDNWSQVFKFGDTSITFKLDSGADINVLPKSSVEKINPRLMKRLVPNNLEIQAFGGYALDILGHIKLKLINKGKCCTFMFAVMPDRKGIRPILGREASEQLGLIQRLDTVSKETVDSSDGELESGTGRASLGLGFCFASFASA
ncbi:hypothetical protein M8J77_007621 [Diaphorina citri]|nr:hypothetical protein M8J77_007621 [Diaphorina citri]